MPCIFPGMDPSIEGQEWEDFHPRFQSSRSLVGAGASAPLRGATGEAGLCGAPAGRGGFDLHPGPGDCPNAAGARSTSFR